MNSDDASPTKIRERTDDDAEPVPKRLRSDAGPEENSALTTEVGRYSTENLLPPSHVLLPPPPPGTSVVDGPHIPREIDVGITEYVSKDAPKIEGIIKQRFTDFLVFEVDPQGTVVHIKSIAKPDGPSKKEKGNTKKTKSTASTADSAAPTTDAPGPGDTPTNAPTSGDTASAPAPPPSTKDLEPWPESFTTILSPLLSQMKIDEFKEMFLQGPVPPFVSDGGWGSRKTDAGPQETGSATGDTATDEANTEATTSNEPEPETEPTTSIRGNRGRGKAIRGGRGARGSGRGGRGGGGPAAGKREDHRKVVSDPIPSKEQRTALHKAVRELFGGKFETATDETKAAGVGDEAGTGAETGSAIVIRWWHGPAGHNERGRIRNPVEQEAQNPPFIHFALQKTNRDTHDALGHISRLLRVNVKDLTVAGTKDKRGVTVQRVSLKRNGKTIEDVWRMANGLMGRRNMKQALTQRGERGVRISDLEYKRGHLELGMLKGNAFIITLRNVKVADGNVLNGVMESIKRKGFINYYGMQRFGTASVPTHAIGLALLQSNWARAVSLLLQPRPGEFPEAEAARRAWLEDKDLDKALELMPRRVVAERCILESFKKQGGESRNCMGALSTIPKNLRLMYVHAYQSYVWNAIVSERIKTYGCDAPVVGDLVFDQRTEAADRDVSMDAGNLPADAPTENEIDAQDTAMIDAPAEEPEANPEAAPVDGAESSSKGTKGKKVWTAPRVKTLTEEDLGKYTIFDVIMPLPGNDVAYPTGPLGERYREFLKLDGLDPDNFVRKQKDYQLSGSYRKIIHLPQDISWSILRYTDPDVALAQSDEDKILGFDPPATEEDGKFIALQVKLTLGTAAYATMALREVTKTETSSHYQTMLTQASEDQAYKGGDAAQQQQRPDTLVDAQ